MRKYALNLAKDGQILSATYEEYATEGMPIVDALPEGSITDYRYVDGEYVYDPIPEAEPSAEEQITELKAQLTATDYKVIKCSEAQMAGEPLPYNIVALHAERQALRDQINALEAL